MALDERSEIQRVITAIGNPKQTSIYQLGPYRYGHTDIQQTNTDTYTTFRNLYQTNTDIFFEIHIKRIPIPISY